MLRLCMIIVVAFIAVTETRHLYAQTEVRVDLLPSNGKFSGVAQPQWNIADLKQIDAKVVVDELLAQPIAQFTKSIPESRANLFVLLSGGNGELFEFEIPGVAGKLKIPRFNPRIAVVLFYQPERANNDYLIPFTATIPTGYSNSVVAEISLKVNTTGMDLASWVYFNMPRIQGEAQRKAAKVIYVDSTTDESFDEVILPGQVVAKISKRSPVLKVRMFW